MSISLNVVRNAAVFCDSFKRLAVTCRIRVILTRVVPAGDEVGASLSPPADGALAGAGAAFDGEGGEGGAAAAFGASEAAGFVGAGAGAGPIDEGVEALSVGASPPVSILNSGALRPIVSPSSTKNSTTTPASGAVIGTFVWRINSPKISRVAGIQTKALACINATSICSK